MGSRYFFQPSSPDEILDGFNSSMSGKKLLFLDELMWGGDRSKAGTLKKLITEKHWTIKTKHLPDYTTKNLFGVIIASNEQWVVPAGTNARRWCVLDCDNELAGIDHKKSDTLKSIYTELADPIKILNLAKTLYTWDLSKFEDRKPPQTDGLRTQKMMSFRPWEKYAYQALNQGFFEEQDNEYNFGCFASKLNIFKNYQRSMSDKHTTAKVFWANMQEMIGGDLGKTKMIRQNGAITRGFILPTLENSRNSFKTFIGDVGWTFDEIEEDDEIETDDEDE